MEPMRSVAQPQLDLWPQPSAPKRAPLAEELAQFRDFGQATSRSTTRVCPSQGGSLEIETYLNEFWTAKQRDAHSLHEVSYRACFKPQLPRFFIERLTAPRDVVYDPFMGRGTTLVEAALLGRIPFGNDINPLSTVLAKPRLSPPELKAIGQRLQEIPFCHHREWPEELLVFYHPETLGEIVALKEYLIEREAEHRLDALDEWIRMTAINRLTGHSPGFFSVYTMPPNQAVSVKSQQRINLRRDQVPPRRKVPDLILKKSRQLLGDFDPAARRTLAEVGPRARFFSRPADATAEIPSGSVKLVVTSPPFLSVVQYATDNWLRCWFLGLDAQAIQITMAKNLAEWQAAMSQVFQELTRVLARGGHVAFEVGEIHAGTVKLEETVLLCGHAAGLEPVLVLINAQDFTKTANCWGVDNNEKGTNTNRIVLFRKTTA